MKYILKTEVNESGNLVFSKQRNGKSFIYLAKDETGATATVDKDWILQNQKNIVNLGVSNDSIYPVEVKGTKTSKVASIELNPFEAFLVETARKRGVEPHIVAQEVHYKACESNAPHRLLFVDAFLYNLADNNNAYTVFCSGAPVKVRELSRKERQLITELLYLKVNEYYTSRDSSLAKEFITYLKDYGQNFDYSSNKSIKECLPEMLEDCFCEFTNIENLSSIPYYAYIKCLESNLSDFLIAIDRLFYKCAIKYNYNYFLTQNSELRNAVKIYCIIYKNNCRISAVDSYAVSINVDNPAGEDYSFDLSSDIMFSPVGISDYLRNYMDVDEYVKMWLEAKSDGVSGVPDAVELVDNARHIEMVLKDISVELLKIK